MIAMLMLKLAAVPTKVKVALGIAAVIALALTLAYCNGRKEGKARADLALERANNQTIKIDSKAREAASDARVVDAVKNMEAKKELQDEIAKLPDSVPSDHRIALGCKRLQRQGSDLSSIPACRGR